MMSCGKIIKAFCFMWFGAMYTGTTGAPTENITSKKGMFFWDSKDKMLKKSSGSQSPSECGILVVKLKKVARDRSALGVSYINVHSEKSMTLYEKLVSAKGRSISYECKINQSELDDRPLYVLFINQDKKVFDVIQFDDNVDLWVSELKEKRYSQKELIPDVVIVKASSQNLSYAALPNFDCYFSFSTNTNPPLRTRTVDLKDVYANCNLILYLDENQNPTAYEVEAKDVVSLALGYTMPDFFTKVFGYCVPKTDLNLIPGLQECLKAHSSS